MQNNSINYIFKLVLMLFIMIVGFKFFVFLLPVILIGIIAYIIYNYFRKPKKSSSINKVINNGNKKVMEAEVLKEENSEE